MANTFKVLGQVKPGAASLTTLYTVPALTQAIAATVVACNQSATPTAFRVSVQVAGAADDPKQYVAYDVPIGGNAVVPLPHALVLGAGDIIKVYNTLATVSFTAFGEEIT